MPIRPPMPPPCASWPCGACAIRRVVAPWDEASGADGLFLDITGCAHLFGGEAELLADLAARLRAFGLCPALAIADTAGAAWAVAPLWRRRDEPDRAAGRGRQPRSATCRSPRCACRRGYASRSCAGSASGASASSCDQPRAPLRGPLRAPSCCAASTRRWGARPSRSSPVVRAARLSRARHVPRADPEPRSTCSRPPRACCGELAEDLARDAVGARVLRLAAVPRATARCASLDIGLAAPSRDAEHIAQPDRPAPRSPGGATLEADFGFEAAAVHVLVAEPCAERQDTLGLDEDGCRARGARPADRPPAAAAGRGRRAPAAPASEPHPRARRACAAAPSPRLRGDEGPRQAAGEVCGAAHRQPSPHRRVGRGTCRPPAAPAAAARGGRGGGAHPGRAAAAVPLARRPAPGGGGARSRAHRARNGGARTRRGDARLLRRRGRGGPPLLALPRRPLRPRATPPRTGSCTGCSDERAGRFIPPPSRGKVRGRGRTRRLSAESSHP